MIRFRSAGWLGEEDNATEPVQERREYEEQTRRLESSNAVLSANLSEEFPTTDAAGNVVSSADAFEGTGARSNVTHDVSLAHHTNLVWSCQHPFHKGLRNRFARFELLGKHFHVYRIMPDGNYVEGFSKYLLSCCECNHRDIGAPPGTYDEAFRHLSKKQIKKARTFSADGTANEFGGTEHAWKERAGAQWTEFVKKIKSDCGKANQDVPPWITEVTPNVFASTCWNMHKSGRTTPPSQWATDVQDFCMAIVQSQMRIAKEMSADKRKVLHFMADFLRTIFGKMGTDGCHMKGHVCPHCKRMPWVEHAWVVIENKDGKRYYCIFCGKRWKDMVNYKTSREELRDSPFSFVHMLQIGGKVYIVPCAKADDTDCGVIDAFAVGTAIAQNESPLLEFKESTGANMVGIILNYLRREGRAFKKVMQLAGLQLKKDKGTKPASDNPVLEGSGIFTLGDRSWENIHEYYDLGDYENLSSPQAAEYWKIVILTITLQISAVQAAMLFDLDEAQGHSQTAERIRSLANYKIILETGHDHWGKKYSEEKIEELKTPEGINEWLRVPVETQLKYAQAKQEWEDMKNEGKPAPDLLNMLTKELEFVEQGDVFEAPPTAICRVSKSEEERWNNLFKEECRRLSDVYKPRLQQVQIITEVFSNLSLGTDESDEINFWPKFIDKLEEVESQLGATTGLILGPRAPRPTGGGSRTSAVEEPQGESSIAAMEEPRGGRVDRRASATIPNQATPEAPSEVPAASSEDVGQVDHMRDIHDQNVNAWESRTRDLLRLQRFNEARAERHRQAQERYRQAQEMLAIRAAEAEEARRLEEVRRAEIEAKDKLRRDLYAAKDRMQQVDASLVRMGRAISEVRREEEEATLEMERALKRVNDLKLRREKIDQTATEMVAEQEESARILQERLEAATQGGVADPEAPTTATSSSSNLDPATTLTLSRRKSSSTWAGSD